MPQMLSYSIEKGLDPKVDFFKSIGFSDVQITRILCSFPAALAVRTEVLQLKIDYIVGLGVPPERITQCVSNAPHCLQLKISRIQETVDALDAMLGEGAGVRALVTAPMIVTYNIDGLRRSFKFLTSVVGFTPEQLGIHVSHSKCRRYPPTTFRVPDIEGIDTIATRGWIKISNRVFMRKYPDFENYLEQRQSVLYDPRYPPVQCLCLTVSWRTTTFAKYKNQENFQLLVRVCNGSASKPTTWVRRHQRIARRVDLHTWLHNTVQPHLAPQRRRQCPFLAGRSSHAPPSPYTYELIELPRASIPRASIARRLVRNTGIADTVRHENGHRQRCSALRWLGGHWRWDPPTMGD
jgi:hypothetical protein